eukprot:7379510-Prymnesium_polylepis.1
MRSDSPAGFVSAASAAAAPTSASMVRVRSWAVPRDDHTTRVLSRARASGHTIVRLRDRLAD